MAYRIDPYKFLPRSMLAAFKAFPHQEGAPPPAAATVPLNRAKVALLTSAGLYLKDSQPPFDIERERREPFWGDPSYRLIPRGVKQSEIAAAHLHVNPEDVLRDFNIVLPLSVFQQLENEGVIGELAHDNYSFMGYQGQSATLWRDRYGAELAERLRSDGVNLLIAAPS